MKILSYTGFLFFFMLGLTSCAGKQSDKRYVDIPGYFENEIQYVKSNYTTVSKLAVYNGDSSASEKKVTDVNWKKEWAIFLESDINKPIYYANMTEMNSGEYVSHSKKLSIQHVKLHYDSTSVSKPSKELKGIELSIIKGNLISSTTIHAIYRKDWGYTITGNQDIHYLNSHHSYFVEGQFH